MSKRANYKQESRKDWGRELQPGETLDKEDLTMGAILRIADAVEIMAKDRVKLESDLRDFKEMYYRAVSRINELERSRNTYKGKFNSLKKKLEESK